MNEKEGGEKINVTEERIREAVKGLLNFAYEGLKEPTYIGYPTSDLIACFLDAETALKDEFHAVFGDAVPDYKGKWKQFKKDVIERRLDDILNEVVKLKPRRKSSFDYYSKNYKLMSNISIASTLFTIFYYIRSNRGWMTDKRKEKLKKGISILMDNKITGKGWQYFHSGSEELAAVLPTWLSMIALTYYIPEEIMKEERNLETEIETVKTEIKEWLLNPENIHIDDEHKHRSWSFQPDKPTESGKPTNNPTATAHAILTLFVIDRNVTDKVIDYAINYIKDKKNEIAYTADKTVYLETKISVGGPGGATTSDISFPHAGIQQCLQALLTVGESSEDESVQYILKANLEKSNEFIGHLQNFEECKVAADKTALEGAMELVEGGIGDIYGTLLPFLYHLYPPTSKKPILRDSTGFKNEFGAFVSGAGSIILLGEIDTTYASIISKSTNNVVVFYRDGQDECVLNPNWTRYYVGYKLNYINCVIVDESKIMFSNAPFRVMDRYNICDYLDGDGVSEFIKQIEEITGKVIRKDWIDRIFEAEGMKNFSEHWAKYMKSGLETMNPEGEVQEGILQYFKHNPEYTEASPTSLCFDSREDAEIKLASHGIISRVFTNGELIGLIKNEIKDKNFVLDESSAYLLANSIKIEDNIKSLLATPVEDLYIPIDVHAILENVTLPSSTTQRLQKIDDKDVDPAEIESERYSLTENEKIAIAFTNIQKDSKYGMITNSWEVAKVCMELDINVYSLVKFLDRDEETYKMFRIPIDLLKEV